jgi:hypothetical protein
MKPARRLLPAALGCCLVAGLVLARPAPAGAAEVTVFLSGASPDSWAGGWGGMLTITLFSVVGAEVELAHQGSDLADTGLWTLSGKAYLGPSFGQLTPYVGLGAGVYRESLPTASDQGTLGSVFAGAKLKFPFGLVVRGEYQWLSLPEGALVPIDHRYFFGLGLGF